MYNYIRIEELDNFLYESMIEAGYAPSTEEIETISDYIIQFFMMKGIAKEEGG